MLSLRFEAESCHIRQDLIQDEEVGGPEEGRDGLPFDDEAVLVLVGPEKAEFTVHKKLLCTTSNYFRDAIDAIPTAVLPSPPPSNRCSPEPDGRSGNDPGSATTTHESLVMWLSTENSDMFDLFILWLYHHQGYQQSPSQAGIPRSAFIDDAAIASAGQEAGSPSPTNCHKFRALHWSLVRLHLFAAQIDLPALQDTAMDALQDLHLRCDWDVAPRLLSLLFSDTNRFSDGGDEDEDASVTPATTCRLRKWAVAMLAFALSGCLGGCGSKSADGVVAEGQFQGLLDSLPDLRDQYAGHLAKMAASKADVRIKNPQLRLPENHLRNEERHFGFRQCSFHSHRKVVGQGRCTHAKASFLQQSGRLSPTWELTTSHCEPHSSSDGLETVGRGLAVLTECDSPSGEEVPPLVSPLPAKGSVSFLDLD
ncbi:uncharacterized protein E0L32_011061 [Thyridium curvatum]|uniref:BTB domain-containing protein n=1 Tax=Thyridium curvatum TaxID=1093900 RepID=A0A507AIJ5_9PEZI|nr:uncharacterized protein E0L32_011061 [Thyridium curvatum]TPX06993.1 hypothetical protein E0L32_011061 [Thyridium curvatum]